LAPTPLLVPTEIFPRVWGFDLLLREGAARAQRLGHPILVSLTRRVAARDPLTIFAEAAGGERALWFRPATGESIVGLGAAYSLVATGPERYQHVAQAWRNLLADGLVEDPERLAWTGPVLLGGFSFDPLRPAAPHWAGLPPARLVLPERLLTQHDGEAWQTTNVLVPRSCPVDEPQNGAVGAMGQPETWQALVESVARGIRDGSLGIEKVVLAREAHVYGQAQFEPDACLRRLAAEYPTCTVFAVAQNNDACFLGATPERLAQARQGNISTMALAGSIARGATPAEDEKLGQRLLASAKERAEHAVVVRAVREALSSPGLCTSLVVDTQPRLARLPNVQHLLTPIHAQLAPDKTLLDLLARLHPSPAVGGFPTPRALAIIREREGIDRGWYGGPFGWLNASGDGEFVVSIRAGLLRGRAAWLYAGCGIVADSDPAAEYAESELKLRPMRSALGLSAW
jgi:isochorismate synthase